MGKGEVGSGFGIFLDSFFLVVISSLSRAGRRREEREGDSHGLLEGISQILASCSGCRVLGWFFFYGDHLWDPQRFP